jgi:hypothetical protein
VGIVPFTTVSEEFLAVTNGFSLGSRKNEGLLKNRKFALDITFSVGIIDGIP